MVIIGHAGLFRGAGELDKARQAAIQHGHRLGVQGRIDPGQRVGECLDNPAAGTEQAAVARMTCQRRIEKIEHHGRLGPRLALDLCRDGQGNPAQPGGQFGIAVHTPQRLDTHGDAGITEGVGGHVADQFVIQRMIHKGCREFLGTD
ncbi:MAG: hypothetical protein GX590_00620 [Lentisphaerae bacterium]|nr:hypothetical protein [Lentisphaerota bacterium]